LTNPFLRLHLWKSKSDRAWYAFEFLNTTIGIHASVAEDFIAFDAFTLDLLHKSEEGEAFADKNLDLTNKFERKCFAPTAKNRLLQEVYCYRRIKNGIDS
jgi:hypothetical protein